MWLAGEGEQCFQEERNGGSEKGHEINSKLNKTLGLCGSGTNSQVQAPDKKLTQ